MFINICPYHHPIPAESQRVCPAGFPREYCGPAKRDILSLYRHLRLRTHLRCTLPHMNLGEIGRTESAKPQKHCGRVGPLRSCSLLRAHGASEAIWTIVLDIEPLSSLLPLAQAILFLKIAVISIILSHTPRVHMDSDCVTG